MKQLDWELYERYGAGNEWVKTVDILFRIFFDLLFMVIEGIATPFISAVCRGAVTKLDTYQRNYQKFQETGIVTPKLEKICDEVIKPTVKVICERYQEKEQEQAKRKKRDDYER